ncbi:MAG: DUF4332 domain-containing protein [Planctomycetaceae bacterium]
MRFVDISIEQFGVLNNSHLRDLPRGLTVVYGGNGSGKTTLVSFMQGLLFGYTTHHEGFQVNDSRFGGSITLQSQGRTFRMTRERSRGISSDLSVVDLATGQSVSRHAAELPGWVNETVYDEIFSVGPHEAARFDLLTRLCLDDNGVCGAEDEIRRTERAIQAAVNEREGNDRGLRQRMAKLRSMREELSRELLESGRSTPGIPARIAEIESEIQRLNAALATVDQQIAETQAEIRRLEELLANLRRRNVVPLDRRAIETRISNLVQRQQRWAEIRHAVQREISTLTGSTSATVKSGGFQGTDSVHSIRALVSRLEQRIDALKDQGLHGGLSSTVQSVSGDRDIFVDHIRSEVFSLCDYVKKHESAIASHEASLEALLGQRALQDADNVDAVLQGQIDALRDELNRSDDVVAVSHSRVGECDSAAHAAHRLTASGGQTVNGSIDEVERQLARQRHRLEELLSERRSMTERLQRLEAELRDLRLQLKPVARLEDIDRMKHQIAEIDAQLKLLQDRWNVLEQTEANLRNVIERLREYRSSGVLELASDYIERLTGGDCYQLSEDVGGTQILATTRQSSRPQPLKQLSRGTLDQVALALRLALIQYRADESERCPLILDDVFITSDDDRAEAAADLLMEIAASGQQIIFFTCQNDVLDLFTRREAHIRTLDGPVVESVRPDPVPAPAVAAVPQTLFATPAPVLTMPVPPPLPRPVAAPVAAKPKESTNWLYYLEVDNSVEDLSGLTVAEVEAFRATDINIIDNLLTISVDDLEARFRSSGYSISRDRIRAWRGQAELATQVPMLRRSDAELLYAAGIQSTVELSRLRPETVYDKVAEFQNSQMGQRYRRSGRVIDRQQAINWSRWSQHARSLSDARQSRSRYFVKASDSYNSPADALRLSRSGDQSISYRREKMAQTGSTVRRQPRPNLTHDAQRLQQERLLRRRQRVARHSSSYRTTTRNDDDSRSITVERKFYLNRSDDVEAAPSIGPRTAQHLAKVGIYTVDDLLKASAVDVAAQLNNRRINADTILQWQGQARLVCQIPDLRGHDAQILVACGITEPEQLSAKRPVDLMALVGPFVDTSEGERIVRGGRKPDLEEVTDWIASAQNSRSLTSAA